MVFCGLDATIIVLIIVALILCSILSWHILLAYYGRPM